MGPIPTIFHFSKTSPHDLPPIPKRPHASPPPFPFSSPHLPGIEPGTPLSPPWTSHIFCFEKTYFLFEQDIFSVLRRHIFCSKKTYFLYKEDTFVFEKKTYSVRRRKIIHRPKYSAVRGPDHWAIFAQQECLSKEALSLANPGRGVPIPAGAFSASKIVYPVFSAAKISSFFHSRLIF